MIMKTINDEGHHSAAVDMSEGCSLYPTIENISEDSTIEAAKMVRNSRKEFTMYVIDENMKKINQKILKSEKKVYLMRRASDALLYTGSCFNALAVGASATGLGTAASGVGIAVGIPLGIVAATSGLVGAVCNAVQAKLTKKSIEKMESLSASYDIRTKVHLIYAKSIQDNVIDETEFKNLMYIMNEFDRGIVKNNIVAVN